MTLRYHRLILLLLSLCVEISGLYLITSTARSEFGASFREGQQATVCTHIDTKVARCMSWWSASAQNIPTTGGTKWESFTIGHDIFLAVANHRLGANSAIDSVIYRWNTTTAQFVTHQKIATLGAIHWRSFTIGNNTYLAVANRYSGSYAINSIIYRWNAATAQFVSHQSIPTLGATRWESFTIGNSTYLAVANPFSGSSYAISSVIYRWNEATSQFVTHQSIPTMGGNHWECFTIGNDTFLAVTNHQSGSNYAIDSVIYRWSATTAQFVSHQSIPTIGAAKWESFTIGSDTYLAVANHYSGSSHAVNSVIYRWNAATAQFVSHQSIPTIGANSWESFTVGDNTFLAVANNKLDVNYAINSVIYRWNAATAQFVIHQRIPTLGANDWKSFNIGGHTYLAVANYNSGSSHAINSVVYRVGTTHALQSNSTHVQMYIVSPGAESGCLFSPQTVHSPQMRYMDALSRGFSFGISVFSSHGSRMWYSCDNRTSSLHFYNTSSPMPACPLSAVVDCGVAGIFLTQAANWRAGVRHTNSSIEILATRSVFQLQNVVLRVDRVQPIASTVEQVVLQVFGAGWKVGDQTLETVARLNGQLCQVNQMTMTEFSVDVTCMMNNWIIADISITAGNQEYTTQIALAPHISISRTQVQWNDYVYISGHDLQLQLVSRISFVATAVNASFDCVLIILSANEAECHIRMLPRLALPATAAIHITLAGIRYATAALVTVHPAVLPGFSIPYLAVCSDTAFLVSLPRKRITGSDFALSGMQIAPSQRVDEVKVWIGSVPCRNASYQDAGTVSCIAPHIPFGGAPLTIQLAQQINVTSTVLISPPSITFTADKAVITLVANINLSSVDVSATGMCVPCANSQLIPWNVSVFVMHQKCQRIVCVSLQVIRCEGIHLNASYVEATTVPADANLPGTRYLPVAADMINGVVHCSTCLVVAVRPVLLTVQPANVPGTGAIISISGYHMFDQLQKDPIVSVMIGSAICGHVTPVSISSLTCIAPDVSPSVGGYPLLPVRLRTANGIMSSEVMYIRYPSAFFVEWIASTPAHTLSSDGSALGNIFIYPAPSFRISSASQASCTVRIAPMVNMQCVQPYRVMWEAPTSFTLRGETAAEILEYANYTLVTLPRISAIGPSGCSTNLSVVCTDLSGRTANSGSGMSFSIPPWNLTWMNRATVVAPPSTLPNLTAQWIVFSRDRFVNASALPTRASCVAVLALQSVAKQWGPHDNLRVLEGSNAISSQRAVIQESVPGTLELLWSGMSLQAATLGSWYSILAECTWTATGERIRMSAIPVCLPNVSVHLSGSSNTTALVGYESLQFTGKLTMVTERCCDSETCQTPSFATASGSCSLILRDMSIGALTNDEMYSVAADGSLNRPISARIEGPPGASGSLLLSCVLWGRHTVNSDPVPFILAPMLVHHLPPMEPLVVLPSSAASPDLPLPGITLQSHAYSSLTCTLRIQTFTCPTPGFLSYGVGFVVKPTIPRLVGDGVSATITNLPANVTTTHITMQPIGIHGPSGCTMWVAGACSDGAGRSNITMKQQSMQTAKIFAAWNYSDDIALQLHVSAPVKLPVLDLLLFTNHLWPSQMTAGFLCDVLLLPADVSVLTSTPLTSYIKSAISVGTVASFKLLNASSYVAHVSELTAASAALGDQLALHGEVTWIPTGERIRLLPINISIPTINITIQDEVSSSTFIVTASSTDVFLVAHVHATLPILVPAMSCSWVTLGRTANSLSLDAPQQQHIPAGRSITSLQPLQLIARGESPSLVAVLLCEVWSHSIRSNPITLVSAPMEIVAFTSLPSRLIPSDTGSRWLVNASISIGVRAFYDGITADFFKGGDIRCSLTVTAAEPATLVSPNPNTPLSAYTEVTANDQGVITFPRFGVRTEVSLHSVNMSVVCTRPAGDGPQPLMWQIVIVPLRIQLCSSQRVFTHTSAAFGVLATVARACDARPELRLPHVLCTLQSVNVSTVVQGGVIEADEISGELSFPSVIVTAPPGSENELRLTCTIGSLSIPPVDGIPLYVTLTGCAPGQFASNAFCRECNPGQYSLGGAATHCTPCPADGVLCANGILTLLPNYYRPQRMWGMPLDTSSELHPCFNGEACIVNGSSLSHACAEGYGGPLCGVCDSAANYARVGDACRSCSDGSRQAGLLALLLIAVIALLTYVALRRTDGQRQDASIVLKIAMSYLQAIGSLRTFQAGGTKAYNDLMGWTDVVSANPMTVSSLQCVWKPPFLIQNILAVLLPPLAAASVMIIFVSVTLIKAVHWRNVLSTCRRCDVADDDKSLFNRDEFANAMGAWIRERRHTATTVFVVFVAYMGIISASLRTIDCYDTPIDGVTYLRSDLSVRCYSEEHIAAVILAYICLIVFGIGFPFGLYWYLATSSAAELADTQLRAAWGFLYDGYRGAEQLHDMHSRSSISEAAPTGQRRGSRLSLVSVTASAALMSEDTKQRCGVAWQRMKAGHMKWWEAVVLIRKTGVVLMAVLVTNAYIQTAIAIVWFMLFLCLHLYFAPYASSTFNVLETLSLSAATLTSVIAIALLQYDISDPAFKTKPSSAMTSNEWAVTGFLAAINLTTFIILAAIWLYYQCRRVSQATHALRLRTSVSFSRKSKGGSMVQHVNPLAQATGVTTKQLDGDFLQANPLRDLSAQTSATAFPPLGVDVDCTAKASTFGAMSSATPTKLPQRRLMPAGEMSANTDSEDSFQPSRPFSYLVQGNLRGVDSHNDDRSTGAAMRVRVTRDVR